MTTVRELIDALLDVPNLDAEVELYDHDGEGYAGALQVAHGRTTVQLTYSSNEGGYVLCRHCARLIFNDISDPEGRWATETDTDFTCAKSPTGLHERSNV